MRPLLLALFAVVAAAVAYADPAAEFFKGRTVTLYIGYGPGGGYDLYSRLLATYLGRHIPGHPAIVPENQPGAGSLKLANELYNLLPKDGTALGMIGEVLVISQRLGDPQARFDAQKFNWIGRLVDSDPVLMMRRDAPVASMMDALTKESLIGVPGAGSATFLNLTVVNALLGTKFKLVSGYEGSAQIRLAVERGEVQGTSSTLWRVEKDWVRQQNLRVLYQTPLEREPDLADVPTLTELGRTDDERKMLRFFSSYTIIGRSILAPPGVPADRVAALQAAFSETMKDPAFAAEAAKSQMVIDPLDGPQIAALLKEAYSAPPDIRARVAEYFLPTR